MFYLNNMRFKIVVDMRPNWTTVSLGKYIKLSSMFSRDLADLVVMVHDVGINALDMLDSGEFHKDKVVQLANGCSFASWQEIYDDLCCNLVEG